MAIGASVPDDGRQRIRTVEASGRSIAEVAVAKAGRSIAVCVPCRNEEATIGPIVGGVRRDLMGVSGAPNLVDELIVVDDRSTDGTADVAAGAGATVFPIEKAHAVHGDGSGKGNVLWASLLATTADIVVWVDGDLTSFEPEWVAHLAAPLLDDPGVALVKASASRPEAGGGGGRTTELVARPLLSLYFPALAELRQPLIGEYAGRRSVLEQLPFVEGWGVEVGLLIDVATLLGADAIAQVDIGVRTHTHRTLDSLSLQAAEVMATILGRVATGSLLGDGERSLRRPDGTEVPLNLAERPPVAAVP